MKDLKIEYRDGKLIEFSIDGPVQFGNSNRIQPRSWRNITISQLVYHHWNRQDSGASQPVAGKSANNREMIINIILMLGLSPNWCIGPQMRIFINIIGSG